MAFLNTGPGTIYIGYNDKGTLIGIDCAKEIEEKISNSIKTNITPDCRIFVSVNTEAIDKKEFISIKISKGLDIYYLKNKGILKGTYLRTGSCSIPASEEVVKQMIIKNNNLSFETSISNNQNLTFNYIKSAFLENNINIENDNIKTNLHLMQDNHYTNLALLLSDQNPFTVKLAAYQSLKKENFLDRKEFRGSLLEIYDKIVEYIQLNTAVYGLIESSVRTDIEEFPSFIVREIVLNSLIHRDYSSLFSNIINIYKEDGLEFISYGSLYGNITIDDILAGLSATRNPYLQAIFMRLKRVEAIGSGLRRVNSYYESKGLHLTLKALPSSFVVNLPIITINNSKLTDDENKKIIDYVNKNGNITRKEAENLIHKEKTTTSKILNNLVDNNILIKIGNGPSTKYEITSSM